MILVLNELFNITVHLTCVIPMRILLKVIKNIEYSLLLLENREEKNSIHHLSGTFHRGSLYEDRYETQKKYISFGNSSLINRRISSSSFPSRSFLLGYLLRERLTTNLSSIPAFAKSGIGVLSAGPRVKKESSFCTD